MLPTYLEDVRIVSDCAIKRFEFQASLSCYVESDIDKADHTK